MTDIIYILTPDGKPLMPTRRFKKIRHLLKIKQAIIACYKPFTVKLCYEPETCITQRVIDGTDPGRTNIGACCITETGNIFYADVTITRNKEVPKNMKKRKLCRMASRRGERKIRKRRARKNKTLMKGKQKQRHLPGYGDDKTVTVKDIINTEARFLNRKRSEKWLTPTAHHLVQTHLNGLKNRMKRLPITDAVIELNKFAFMAMDNPNIKRWQYQQGPLYQKGAVKNAVSEMQDHHCLFCKKPIDEYHHHEPQHRNGSNTIANIVGLCDKHHKLVHNDQIWSDKLDTKHTALTKKYGALSIINQAIPFILDGYVKILGVDHVHVTDGYTTYQLRNQLCLPKNHDQDAYAIAASILETPTTPDTFESLTVRQFRRHDRAMIKSQTERIYRLNGEIVAKNRRKRTDQKDDSLVEWYQKTIREHGRATATLWRSQLIVTKSQRRYNNPDRVMPGAIFLYQNKRYVLQGQLTGGRYYRAVGQGTTNFPASDCKIVAKNTGLVTI